MKISEGDINGICRIERVKLIKHVPLAIFSPDIWNIREQKASGLVRGINYRCRYFHWVGFCCQSCPSATCVHRTLLLSGSEYSRPHYFPADKAFTMNAFDFQLVVEAFHISTIVTVALCTHATMQVMLFQQRLIIRYTV